MKDNEKVEETGDFELDYDQVAELRRKAQQQSRAQANVVDGDPIESDEEE